MQRHFSLQRSRHAVAASFNAAVLAFESSLSMNTFDHLRTKWNVIKAGENCHSLLKICSLFKATNHFKTVRFKSRTKGLEFKSSKHYLFSKMLTRRHLQILAAKTERHHGIALISIWRPELSKNFFTVLQTGEIHAFNVLSFLF